MKRISLLFISIFCISILLHSQTTGYIPRYTNTSGTTGNSIVYQSSGSPYKIGIGTIAPEGLFSVYSTTNSYPIARFSFSTTTSIDIAGATNEGIIKNSATGKGLMLGTHNTSGDLNTNQLYLNTNGRVGIGIASPAAKLDINSATGETPLYIRVNNTGKLIVGSNGGVSIGSNTSAPSNGLYVNGNTGLGTVSPIAKLHVNGSTYIPVGNGYYIGSTSESGKRLRIFHDSSWSVIDFDFILRFMGGSVIFGGEMCSNAKVTIQSRNATTTSNEWSNDSPFIIWTGWENDDFALIMGADKSQSCSYINSKQCNTGNATLALNPHGGSVTIGTVDPKGYRFAVAGKMIAEEIVCKTKAYWPDYVFEENYDLLSLTELEEFINKNNHLPKVPKADEIEEKGINLGDMDNILLEKIEELTLYTIQQQKLIDEQQKLLKDLEKASQLQQKMIEELHDKLNK
ncbi:MAG: hypothetical protein LBQ22_05270 [Bacteroidales bacterium]|jgi:hypothetical protein|nr:hypothetical protein [Bacteroidales bacterium]